MKWVEIMKRPVVPEPITAPTLKVCRVGRRFHRSWRWQVAAISSLDLGILFFKEAGQMSRFAGADDYIPARQFLFHIADDGGGITRDD